MSLKSESKDELMQISNDLDEIVCVIDKIGSGFELTEDMALALVLFFKEKKVLDKLSHIRKVVANELSEKMSSSEYDEWIERETHYWKPPYGMPQDELIQKIKERHCP